MKYVSNDDIAGRFIRKINCAINRNTDQIPSDRVVQYAWFHNLTLTEIQSVRNSFENDYIFGHI